MTSLDEQTKKIQHFNKQRGWHPEASDIAKSIVLEAAELLEHFQWDETLKRKGLPTQKNIEEVRDEVADVFWYLISFCDAMGIDLAQAVKRKYQKNDIKYPVKEVTGELGEAFYWQQKKKYREKNSNKTKINK